MKKKQIKFTGTRPPTVADVFLNYCGQHQYLQTETKRQSSRRDAAKRTAFELLLWWKNSGGFSLKNEKTLIDMIIALHNEWKNLSKKTNLQNEF